MNLHDSEKVVGRVRHDGGWDQRFRTPPHSKSHADDATLREFAAALMVCLLVGIAFFLWTAILAVPGVAS